MKVNKDMVANMLVSNFKNVSKNDSTDIKVYHRQFAVNSLRNVNETISAVINFNVNYNAGTLSAGQTLLLQLTTNANKKVVFHSSSGENMSYQTTVFYVENNELNIVEQSTNVLGNYDVDAFIAQGGVYYIQVDITSGSGSFYFLTVELSDFSSNEVCDNIYDALGLTPSATINVSDFFDNRMDYDFFAMNVTDAAQNVYINFGYTSSNIINPLKNNPVPAMMIFYLANNNLSLYRNAEDLSQTIVDKEILLGNPGIYIFALYPDELLPGGQLNEPYNFSVAYSKSVTNNMPGGIHFHLGIVQGAIDQGTYDVNLQSPFWVNGTAVRLAGTIDNWDGIARKCLVRVTSTYGDTPKVCVADISSNGSFDVVVPLFKTVARADSFYYHGETMDWNYIQFLSAQDVNNIPDDSTTFYSSSNPMKYYRLNDIWSNALKVGVCYNDAPLNY